ncbi:hypothetical protein UFOVP1437_42 [uncultured Caudovirales phage]|uniref:Nicotinamide riboside transporter PnuC n=1 Tax=uncultured Caudovirales phage TaxID=2100421 RepID=A0A6J5SFG9_9CAUD|nr:hypothetical protein UFOVP1437_42 [uncultured Caudovirales phage]
MNYIEIMAVITSLAAALILTEGKPHKVWMSLVLWLVGSMLWFIVGYAQGIFSLMFINVCFFFIELYGLFKWVKIKHK